MRFVMHVSMPLEKFNRAVADGSAGDKLQRILDQIQPEGAYFTATDGKRGGYFIVNVDDASQIPSLAEPFFLLFDASVELHVCMTPEDLAAAGLGELGSTWSG